MTDSSNKVHQLIGILNSTPTGLVDQPIVEDVKSLLEGAWNFLHGNTGGGMEAEKIYRAEELRWDKEAQCLTFVIERHGGIVGGGSSRAELQHWKINLKNMSAGYSVGGHRRARDYKPPRRIDMNAIVREIVEAINAENPVEGITRQGTNVVTIAPGHFIPDNGLAAQTLASRRRKFRSVLEVALSELGWLRDANAKPHTFRKT